MIAVRYVKPMVEARLVSKPRMLKAMVLESSSLDGEGRRLRHLKSERVMRRWPRRRAERKRRAL